METLGINYVLKTNATNAFIIATLKKMLPFANKQMSTFLSNGDKMQTLVNAQNLPAEQGIKYKADSWEHQNIQLPSSLINTKQGDCKSFALLIAGYLNANGINNGLEFVAYEPGARQPTHVYNFAIVNGKKYYIDGTLTADRIGPNRAKETFKKEIMNVAVLAAPYDEIGRGGKGLKKVKKVALAPGRGAFLGLVALNVHGIATNLLKAKGKNAGTVEAFWNKLGGDPKKLFKTIETGAKKKRILGTQDEAIGMAVPAMLTAAAPILLALKNLFKSLKVETPGDEDLGNVIPENTEPLGADFEPSDPDRGNRTSKTPGTTTTSAGGSGFSVNPLLLGALALAAIFAFK